MRKAAATALDSLGWQGGEGDASADYWIARRDWDKCAEIGGLAVAPLMAALSDDSATVRKAAASTLGRIGDTRAVEALKAALQDQTKTVCSAAAAAIDSSGGGPTPRGWGHLLDRQGRVVQVRRDRRTRRRRTGPRTGVEGFLL